MGEMTVGELMHLLKGYDADTEVRLAVEPMWPFEHRISDVAEAVIDGETVLYIGDGGQTRYLPGEAQEALGWR